MNGRPFTPLCCWVIALAILLPGLWFSGNAHAWDGTEEEINFRSGQVTLHGTVLIPEGSERAPAIVMLHGAGLGQRNDNRAVAEALVREGLVTLIYDKRTDGYSADPVGIRSYSLLADDAIAAVQSCSSAMM